MGAVRRTIGAEGTFAGPFSGAFLNYIKIRDGMLITYIIYYASINLLIYISIYVSILTPISYPYIHKPYKDRSIDYYGLI